jgi:DNA repair protein RadC
MELKFMLAKEVSGKTLNSPVKVSRLMAEEAKFDRECFWVLHLSTSHKVIEKELVSIGTVDNCLVHAREVFKKAILNGAYAVITVHNHPGGTAKPSKEDKDIWRYLDQAGELLGIEVLDHMIITPSDGYYSRLDVINL